MDYFNVISGFSGKKHDNTRKRYNVLKKNVKRQGINVKLVGNKKLHDYSAMNPQAARVFGYKCPKNTIEIDKKASEKTKLRDLRHEMVEQKLMKDKHMKYFPAHKKALKAERHKTFWG